MPLKMSKGNMYEFVNATWNTVAGACKFSCNYCYMKKWKITSEPHFNENELKCDLGENNFIFVSSGIDLWHSDFPIEWIEKTLTHCRKFKENTYLFQTKNPERFFCFADAFPKNTWLCITLETNEYPAGVNISSAPTPQERFVNFVDFINYYTDRFKYMITIEPIMDFDVDEFFDMIRYIKPNQVNIGADSGNNGLSEPEPDKIIELINKLEANGIKVYKKANLKRLLK